MDEWPRTGGPTAYGISWRRDDLTATPSGASGRPVCELVSTRDGNPTDRNSEGGRRFSATGLISGLAFAAPKYSEKIG